MINKILTACLLLFSFQANALPIDKANTALKNKNYNLAKDLYYDLAVAGNSEAQFLLGRMYVDKQLGKSQFKEGVRWLDIAVKNRHLAAAEMLGMLYMSGNGVKYSPETGTKYFLLASEFRDPFELEPECE